MKGINWKSTVELVGAIAIVASLVFIGIELRQSQEIAKTEISMAALAAGVEINNYIGENADIWTRGSAGEDLSDTDQIVFDKMVGNLESFAFWSHTSFSRLDGGLRAEDPIHNFAFQLHTNPGAMSSYRTRRESMRRYSVLRSAPLQSESFLEKIDESIDKHQALKE